MRTVILAGAWLVALLVLASGNAWLQTAAGAGVTAASFAAYPDRRGFFLACAALGVIGLAWLRWESAAAPPRPDSIAWWADGGRHSLEGRIVARPEARGATQRFVVRVSSVDSAAGPVQATGSVQVRTSVSGTYRAGDHVRVNGQLEPPPTLEGFDYPAYLARRGIVAVMEFPRVRVTGHDRHGGIAGVIEAIQGRGHDALWRGLPAQQAALAEGILLGRRSEIPRDINEDFNRAGVSHLIVISGFNIALVGGVVLGGTAWLLSRRHAGLLALGAIVAYSVIVGLTPPVARAAVMGSVAVLAMLSGRPHGSGVTLLLAAAILTAQDPRILSDLSFQLSFAATAGLIVLAPPLMTLGRRICSEPEPTFRPSWRSFAVAVWDLLAVTLAATLATLPLLLHAFDRLSTVSPLANLLLVPLFPLVLVSGAVGLAIAALVPTAAAVALAPLGFLLDFSLTVTRLCAALPGATLTLRGVSGALVLAAYAVLGLAAFTRIPRPDRALPDIAVQPPAPLSAFSLPALLLVPPMLLSATIVADLRQRPSTADEVRVDALGLAGSHAALVTLPRGGRVLVDTGLAPGGARAALDRLLPRDRSALSAVLITRDAPSAVGGLAGVLERFRVPLLLIPPEADDAEWVDAARSTGVTIVPLRPHLTVGNGVARLQAMQSTEPGRWSVTVHLGSRALDLSGPAGVAGITREGRSAFVYATDRHQWLQTELRSGESVSLLITRYDVRLRPPRGRTISAEPCTVKTCGPPASR